MHDGMNVWVMYNGGLIKLSECRVQPVYGDSDLSYINSDTFGGNTVSFQTTKETDEVGVRTRSMTKEKHNEDVHNYYVEYLSNSSIEPLIENIMTVEIPVKEHGRLDCVEAKQTELQNLLNFDTFEEVEDNGQITIQSRWVLTEKQAHDGQKNFTRIVTFSL